MTNAKHIHRSLIAVATAVVVLWAGTAIGDEPAHPVVDISKVKKKLSILHDGDGHYIVVADWANKRHLYWGDGKVFYKQRWTTGGNYKKTKVLTYGFWSPRDARSQLTRTNGEWKIECSDRTTALTVMSEDEATKVFDEATFYSYYWQRKTYSLHRDDRGVYYYVDRLRDDDYDSIDYRLFIGKKGNLRQTKLVNIVSDSAGDVFSTKKGELRFVTGGDSEAKWLRGDDETILKEVYPTAKLIYKELGVYDGNLGVPCDTL